jgi:hypothetical protein
MEEYGEANLGSKGMALFFSSHLCSPLCFALGLTQFDLNDKVCLIVTGHVIELITGIRENKLSMLGDPTIYDGFAIRGKDDVFGSWCQEEREPDGGL